MIKEEAIAMIQDHMEHHHIGEYPHIKLEEALKLAITALRGPTREQVENVWKGEWIGDNNEKVGTIDGVPLKSATCFACGNWLVASNEYDCSGDFCPVCGRAMTDKAVDIVMQRWEALYDKDV